MTKKRTFNGLLSSLLADSMFLLCIFLIWLVMTENIWAIKRGSRWTDAEKQLIMICAACFMFFVYCLLDDQNSFDRSKITRNTNAMWVCACESLFSSRKNNGNFR